MAWDVTMIELSKLGTIWGKSIPSNMMRLYGSSLIRKISVPCSVCIRFSNSASPAISCGEYTTPEGLLGEFTMIARVRGVTACFDGGQVEPEPVRGVDHHRHAVVIVDIVQVFEEVRGAENDDLIAGIEDGLQDHVRGCSCAAGHHDVAALEGQAGFLGQ